MDPLVVVVVVAALVFGYINGFRDAANSIATVVSTRALAPAEAVAWAAFFNFAAVLIFGTAVARTIGAGLIEIAVVTTPVVLGGLLGAIVWDLIAWYYGLPISSSHALIGGYAGAALAKAGPAAIVAAGWTTTIAFIVLAPLLGLVLGLLFMTIILWLCRTTAPTRVDQLFRRLQLVSAALYSLGHGANDAQKTIGIIAVALVAGGDVSSFDIPTWVVVAAYAAIAAGTISGGWRIIHTMSSKITRLQPAGGFAAETAAAMSLFLASSLGVPVSTTHTITGAIVGVGSVRRLSAVRWGVAGQMVWAWVLTVPAAAVIAAATYYLLAASGLT